MRPGLARAAWPLIATLIACAYSVRIAGSGRGQDATDALRALEAAVNRGDGAALRRAGLGAGADLAWVEQPGRRGPARWTASLLRPPKAPSADSAPLYVAFSRYQVSQSGCDHLYAARETPDGLRLTREVRETETGGWRVTRHEADIRIEPSSASVAIVDRCVVRAERSAPPDGPILRLNAIYRVESVRRNGTILPFRQAGGFVALPRPTGSEAAYTLSYSGTPSSTEDFVRESEAALTSYWWPHTARLPAAATIRVTVPEGWVAIAPGNTDGVERAKRTRTYAWRNAVPVCYHPVAAGSYRVTTRDQDGTAVSAYLRADDAARARRLIDRAFASIRFYARRWGAFPYRSYGIVESSTFPGGLEGYSFTLCGRGTLPGVLAHEVAHTWWGGLVPNAYTASMWNEALATYSEHRFDRNEGDIERAPAAATSRRPWGSTLLSTAHDTMVRSDSAVGYDKGGQVLANLERMIGEERMDEALRRFVADRPSGDAADWPDLADVVGRVAGRRWVRYFDAWLGRADLPVVRMEGIRAERGPKGWAVSGTLTQGGDPFWLAVPLELQTAGTPVLQMANLEGAPAAFRILSPAEPRRLLLDPRGEALRCAPEDPEADTVPLAAGGRAR